MLFLHSFVHSVPPHIKAVSLDGLTIPTEELIAKVLFPVIHTNTNNGVIVCIEAKLFAIISFTNTFYLTYLLVV
jgi:hypothetical protein